MTDLNNFDNFEKEYKVQFGLETSTIPIQHFVFDYDKVGGSISVAKVINRNYTIKKYNTVDELTYITSEVIDPPLTEDEQRYLEQDRLRSEEKRRKEKEEKKRVKEVKIQIIGVLVILNQDIVELSRFFSRYDIMDLE